MFSKIADHLEVDHKFLNTPNPLKLVLKQIDGNTARVAANSNTPHLELHREVLHLTNRLAQNPFQNLLTIRKAGENATRNLKVNQIARKTLDLCQTVVPFGEGNLILRETHKWRAVLRKTKKRFESLFEALHKEGYVDWMFSKQTYLVLSVEELPMDGELRDSEKIICYPIIANAERMGIFIFHLVEKELNFSLSDLEVVKVLVNQTAVGLKFHQFQKQLLRKEKVLNNLNKVILQSAKMAMVGEVASGITHEINNPLQVILGKIQLAMIGHDKQEVLKHIEQQSLQIASLVRSISDISKYRPKDSGEVIELNSLIRNTINQISGQMEKKKIRIELDLDPQSVTVLSNSDYLRQIILNTVLVTKKRMPKGGNLMIKTGSDQNYVRIEFKDDTPGKKPAINKNNLNLDDNWNNLNLDFGEIANMLLVREIGGEIKYDSKESEGNRTLIKIPHNVD